MVLSAAVQAELVYVPLEGCGTLRAFRTSQPKLGQEDSERKYD